MVHDMKTGGFADGPLLSTHIPLIIDYILGQLAWLACTIGISIGVGDTDPHTIVGVLTGKCCYSLCVLTAGQ